LQAVSNDLRRFAGTMDLPELVDELRGHFALRDFPDHAADWERLDHDTRSALAIVRTTIGGVLTIPRVKEHREIEEAFQTSDTVVVLGASGTGKSGLAKMKVEGVLAGGKALWVD